MSIRHPAKYQRRLTCAMILLIVLAVVISVAMTAVVLAQSFSPQMKKLRSQIVGEDVEHVRLQLSGLNAQMTNLAAGEEIASLISGRVGQRKKTEAILSLSRRIMNIACGSEMIQQLFVYVPGMNRIVSTGSVDADTYLRYRVTGDWNTAGALQDAILDVRHVAYLSCGDTLAGEGYMLEILPAPLNSTKPQAYICAIIYPAIELHEDLADIKLLCNEERVLFSTDEKCYEWDERFVSKLLEAQTKEIRLAGNSYHVQVMKLPFEDLRYVYLTSDAVLNGTVRRAYQMAALTCLIFCILAALAAKRCSGTLYHPVGALINALVSQGEIAAGKSYDEINAIGNIVEQLMADNRKLNQMVDALTPMLDDLIFYQTLHQSEISECGAWLQEFEDSQLQLLVMRPANRGVEKSMRDALLKRLAQIGQEQLKPLYRVRAALMDESVYLVVSHSMDPETFRLKTAIAMDEIARQMIALFGSATLCAVSQPFPRSAEIHENTAALRQMVEMCEKGFQEAFLQSQPSGGIWCTQNMPKKESAMTMIPAPLEHSVLTLVANGKAEDAWNALHQFLNEQLYSRQSSYECMWKLLLDGVDLLYKAAANANLSAEEVMGNYYKVCENMKTATAFTDALRTLHGLFQQVDSALSRRTIGLPVSQNALDEYLKEHWLEDISLSRAAEHWHLSEGYFSDVVRRLTGKSFPDYLSWQRLQRAMSMMDDRSLTITEISARAGFNNYKTFARCFYKFYQTSPSDYRRTLAEKSL